MLAGAPWTNSGEPWNFVVINGTTTVANFMDEIIEGNVAAVENMAFICHSCTAEDVTCPAICQYCLPMGNDG